MICKQCKWMEKAVPKGHTLSCMKCNKTYGKREEVE